MKQAAATAPVRRAARNGLIAAAVLAAASCDSPPTAEPGPPIKITNPHHDELTALTPDMQRLGLMRAIRDNGRRCQRVEAAGYQEDYRQMALWVALCNDARQWAVFIAPNGDTQVRQCTEMRQLGLPECRPLDGPPATPPRER